MSDTASGLSTSGSAGALLRAARERQGLHIAALAAAIKIPQRKLEALEADRFDELPDATFTRALAMTVCRALKIDAAPVLAQLPPLGGVAMADVTGGLKTPLRERPGRADPTGLRALRHPLAWAALAVLAAAAALVLLPQGWWQGWLPTSAPAASAAVAVSASTAAESAASAAMAAASAAPAEAVAMAPQASASAATVEVVHSVPSAESGASAAVDVAAGVAVLRALDASWVEVVDAGGQVLVQRLLQPGESLGLDGRLPFKLKIGNAVGTQLQFRGQPVDLAPVTRDNVARLELK